MHNEWGPRSEGEFERLCVTADVHRAAAESLAVENAYLRQSLEDALAKLDGAWRDTENWRTKYDQLCEEYDALKRRAG